MIFFFSSRKPAADHDPPPNSSASDYPRMRFWPGLTVASFSIFNAPSNDIFLRRLSMCIILALDVWVSVLVILAHAFSFSNIPRIVLAVFDFFSTAFLLHLVGRMVGERFVLGRKITRWHFDVFLVFLLLWKVMLIGWYYGGLTRITAGIWWGLDILGFLILLLVGLVARQGPLEDEQRWNQV